jgi:ribosome-binding factor A
LARNLNLRNTPEIRFILDESIEYGVTMSKKIDDVSRADAAARAGREE